MENSKKRLDSFQNVVVLMLENRSFDNLLGYLYDPDNDGYKLPPGMSFDGLQGTDIKMPIHPDSKDHKEKCLVITTSSY